MILTGRSGLLKQETTKKKQPAYNLYIRKYIVYFLELACINTVNVVY